MPADDLARLVLHGSSSLSFSSVLSHIAMTQTLFSFEANTLFKGKHLWISFFLAGCIAQLD